MRLITLNWDHNRLLQRYMISENDQATIGRRSECTITLGDPKVSRLHASISFFQGHFYIYPLAERNPVYVNNNRVTPRGMRLSRGDTIQLGDQVLRVSEIVETDISFGARCPNCQKVNPRQASLCRSCGTNLAEAHTVYLNGPGR